MAEKDDKGVSPLHSGHTRVLNEQEDLVPAQQQQQQQPAGGQQFDPNANWGAHTQALPPEAFDGLEFSAGDDAAQGAAPQPGAQMPGGVGPNQGGQTVAMPVEGQPPGGGYAGATAPPGGAQSGMAGAPGGALPGAAGASGGAPAGGGGVPYLETQAIESPLQQQPYGAPGAAGGAPPAGGAAPGGGGVPYLETQAIESPLSQPSQPPQQQYQAPPPQQQQSYAPPPAQADPESAATVLLDSSSFQAQEMMGMAPQGAPSPYGAPPPQGAPPPMQENAFDSNGLATGGEKTVMLGDISQLPGLATGMPAPSPQQSGKLVIFVPETEPILFELMPGITTVGRGMENHLVLGDPYASRKHLVITCKDGFFAFEDTGSDNGTVVNGQRAVGAPLKTGDVIEIGSVQMRFVQGDVMPQHRARPAPTSPASTGTMAPSMPAQPQAGGSKVQLYLLVVLVLATIALIAVMVVIMLGR